MLRDIIPTKSKYNVNGISRSLSSGSSKQYLHDSAIMKSKHDLIKQKSHSAILDDSKKSRQNKDKSLNACTKNSNDTFKPTRVRQRTKSTGDISSEQDILGSDNSVSPKMRVSSGSFFYSQVVAQQQLHAKQNTINGVNSAEKAYSNKKSKLPLFWEIQVLAFFEKSATQVVFFIVCCQLCVSMYLYYMIATHDAKCVCKHCCSCERCSLI
jgi:hypothetical protein